MKAAPVLAAFDASCVGRQTLVHTGQHYDQSLSDIFFEQLEIRQPDFHLGVGSGTHAKQTADVMAGFDDVLKETKPDWVIVYGDVNSTIAAALVSVKLGIPVAHVEAGLRSFDRRMPEEINRVLTDQISDLLLTSTEDAAGNLAREGIPQERIRFVGNVMIDTLRRLAPKAEHDPSLDCVQTAYAMLTLHRPSNVDDDGTLVSILETVDRLSDELPVVFPVHPRTRSRIEALDFRFGGQIKICRPLGYLECLALQRDATAVITDSGGLQEETTALGVPCLTLRSETERPITCVEGTNTLVGNDMGLLRSEFARVLAGDGKSGRVPEGWDGSAAGRVVEAFRETVARPLHNQSPMQTTY